MTMYTISEIDSDEAFDGFHETTLPTFTYNCDNRGSTGTRFGRDVFEYSTLADESDAEIKRGSLDGFFVDLLNDAEHAGRTARRALRDRPAQDTADTVTVLRRNFPEFSSEIDAFLASRGFTRLIEDLAGDSVANCVVLADLFPEIVFKIEDDRDALIDDALAMEAAIDQALRGYEFDDIETAVSNPRFAGWMHRKMSPRRIKQMEKAAKAKTHTRIVAVKDQYLVDKAGWRFTTNTKGQIVRAHQISAKR